MRAWPISSERQRPSILRELRRRRNCRRNAQEDGREQRRPAILAVVSAAPRPGRVESLSTGSAPSQPQQHRRSLVVLDALPAGERVELSRRFLIEARRSDQADRIGRVRAAEGYGGERKCSVRRRVRWKKKSRRREVGKCKRQGHAVGKPTCHHRTAPAHRRGPHHEDQTVKDKKEQRRRNRNELHSHRSNIEGNNHTKTYLI